jgi:hypothetical protein
MNENELRNKRGELQQRLDAIIADFRSGLDADAEERALQLENEDVLNEIARVCRAEIAAIDQQLVRLQNSH